MAVPDVRDAQPLTLEHRDGRHGASLLVCDLAIERLERGREGIDRRFALPQRRQNLVKAVRAAARHVLAPVAVEHPGVQAVAAAKGLDDPHEVLHVLPLPLGRPPRDFIHGPESRPPLKTQGGEAFQPDRDAGPMVSGKMSAVFEYADKRFDDFVADLKEYGPGPGAGGICPRSSRMPTSGSTPSSRT